MPDLPEEAVEALDRRWPPARYKDGTKVPALPGIATEAAELVAPAIRNQRDEELREWAQTFMAKKRKGPGPGVGCTNLDRVEAEGVKHFLDSIFEEADDA